MLLGSSSGGYVAQQVAITSPHRVTGLALVGSPCSLQGRPSFADEVIVYPDTGHLVLWEQPERVASDLTAFVAGLRQRSA